MALEGDLGNVDRAGSPAPSRECIAGDCNSTILVVEESKKNVGTGGPIAVRGAGVGWHSNSANARVQGTVSLDRERIRL